LLKNDYLLLNVQFWDQKLYNRSTAWNMDYVKSMVCFTLALAAHEFCTDFFMCCTTELVRWQ